METALMLVLLLFATGVCLWPVFSKKRDDNACLYLSLAWIAGSTIVTITHLLIVHALVICAVASLAALWDWKQRDQYQPASIRFVNIALLSGMLSVAYIAACWCAPDFSAHSPFFNPIIALVLIVACVTLVMREARTA